MNVAIFVDGKSLDAWSFKIWDVLFLFHVALDEFDGIEICIIDIAS